MFGDLYPDVPVPKNAGRWISNTAALYLLGAEVVGAMR
jgi:hypothetical protein